VAQGQAERRDRLDEAVAAVRKRIEEVLGG
jgi:hypothetical protein